MDIASLLCPCLKPSPNSSSNNRNGHGQHLETELISQQSRGSSPGKDPSSLSSLYKISKKMSAPTIAIQGLNVRGCGLALVDVSIEQDCAYWEWHVNVNNTSTTSNTNEGGDGGSDDDDDFFNQGLTLKFGVATKKSREFYQALDSNQEDDEMPMEDGTALMKSIQNIQNGDTIGIAVQQDDLPMIQFLLNGEPLHDIAINRFRGMVYPSIYIESDSDGDVDDSVDVQFVWREEDFHEMSPSVRFKPLMAAIGII